MQKELDNTALEVSNQWNRLEQGISELYNTTNKLTEAINEADAKNLVEDPEVLVERTIKKIEEFSQDYLIEDKDKED